MCERLSAGCRRSTDKSNGQIQRIDPTDRGDTIQRIDPLLTQATPEEAHPKTGSSHEGEPPGERGEKEVSPRRERASGRARDVAPSQEDTVGSVHF